MINNPADLISNYQRADWRLIITPPNIGAWNMAVDEALLASIGNGTSLPILRIYSWSPPCLSLGYAQSIHEVDQSNLRKRGWHLVRRLTGGRAILHTDELTYSVIAPYSEPRLEGGVLESYRRISKALLQALISLGAPVEAHELNQHQVEAKITPLPVCFEVPSNYEITARGKKLVGSAQARKRDGILQHGSLPLRGDITRITEALRFDNQQERSSVNARILERATTIESALGSEISFEKASEAFIGAFNTVLTLNLIQDSLSTDELEYAEVLIKEKYTHPTWNERI